MNPPLLIPTIIALACTPALWFIFGKPRYLKSIQKASSPRQISIIIPARDEAANIGCLLKSIQSQTITPYEVIVVDDHSTDDTASIAKANGAYVLSAQGLPKDWKGKPWACQQGADHASGDWYLFLDADTQLLPDALAHLAGAIDATQGESVISISPYHSIQKPYEELSAFFNLLMVTGINAFGLGKGSENNSALFGQCMLISKNHYTQVGGHHVVKSHILENFHLAENLKALDRKLTCYLGRDLITMRMFPEGLSELWNSWKKGFSAGAAKAAPRALILSSIWITGAMFAAITAITILFTGSLAFQVAALICYLIYATQCYYAFRRIGSFSLLNALLFPISLFFYQALFFSSIISKKRGKSTQWKGRSVA
ncbi:glycosyltransferase [Akkermansiaceae bacterium]|nr:glycosyltransferase [Akkermansiaceae bacterium]